MPNFKYLRTHLQEAQAQLKRRGYHLDVQKIAELEEQRRNLQTELQQMQQNRNAQSKSVGLLKSKGEPVEDLLKSVTSLGDKMKAVDSAFKAVQDQLTVLYLDIPNQLHESVPDGRSEADNQVVRCVGDITQFEFPPKDHVDLCGDGMNFKSAAKLSGSRFVVLSGQVARLHRALVQFMLDIHTKEHGYQEKYVPYLVKPEVLTGTGQLPKFAEDQFFIPGDRPLYLMPTAEVALANLVRESVIEAKDLPYKWVAHTPCFRREAGSYGKDTHGMIRQHQFDKVELVQIVRPEISYDVLEQLTSEAEVILQRLALPYRVVNLCSADVGFSAAKTYDLEVWLPSQQGYREIASCSNCEDFQARRMQVRWRSHQNKTDWVHTLNASGLAVGRTLIAVVENYQTKAGYINMPEALRPYMGGEKVLNLHNLA